MPLKKRVKIDKTNPNMVNDEVILRTPNDSVMNLFDSAKLPMVTLNANQFKWPSSFLVRGAKRVKEYQVNPDTGWNLKNDNGDKVETGNYNVRLQVSDGDLAQLAVDNGTSFDGLNELQVTIKKDIPLQKFVPNESLVKLVKPSIMLGYGGNQADRIILLADDCEFV